MSTQTKKQIFWRNIEKSRARAKRKTCRELFDEMTEAMGSQAYGADAYGRSIHMTESAQRRYNYKVALKAEREAYANDNQWQQSPPAKYKPLDFKY